MGRKSMKPEDISQAKDPDIRAGLAALKRAALLARKTAIQTDTDLIIVKEGRLTRITAQELRQMSESEEAKAE
jgi:hypothetical protein